MKLKKVIAGVTALAVIGSTSCFSVFAEEYDNGDHMSDADTVNYEEGFDAADDTENTDAADDTENTDSADDTENADAVDNTENADADTEETAIEEISPEAKSVEINEINFPDGAFRGYVSANFDKDKNGVLTAEEIAAITEVDVNGTTDYPGNISSFKGIEYFTALTRLWCSCNQLTTLDVSKNTALESLDCSYNRLTSLDVSKNTALESLDCSHNRLTSLDVSKNTALESLGCQYNQLTSLDVSNNTALRALYCNNNQLTSLDVSKNTAMVASSYDYNFGYNAFNIGNVKGSYSLSNLKGFDSSNARNWSGAEYDCTTGSLKNFASNDGGKVTYVYECGNNIWDVFTLVYDSYTVDTPVTPEKPTVTAAAGDGSVTLNWNDMGAGVTYKVYSYNKSNNKYASVADVKGTTYTVTGLTNGKEYGYLVRAKVNGAWSAYTVNDVVYATPKGSTASKPTVTATAGDGSVTLKWNSLGTGVKYKVYGYNGAKYTSIASDVTATSYTVKDLKNGTKYGFLVRAYVNGAWTAYTVNDVVYATPKGSTVDKLAVTATAGDKSVTLNWNSLGNGVKYKVYGYNGTKYSAIASDVTATSYTVKDLKNGTKYGFLVRAYVNGAWTAYTVNDVVYATPKSGSTASKPVVTATAGNKQITLKWNSLGTGVTYRIYRYNKTTNKYTAVTTVSGTSYTATGLTNGTEYGYLVRADINGTLSSYTSDDVVYATPKA